MKGKMKIDKIFSISTFLALMILNSLYSLYNNLHFNQINH